MDFEFWTGKVLVNSEFVPWGESLTFEVDPHTSYLLSAAAEGHGAVLARLYANDLPHKTVVRPPAKIHSVMAMSPEARSKFLREMLDWITTETTGLWSLGLVVIKTTGSLHDLGFYISFEQSSEAVAFTLRWS